jgi:hypothetical protein
VDAIAAPAATSPQQIDIWWAPIEDTAQEAFFDDDTPNAALLFCGGWGSGKTMTLWGKALKLSAINNPLPLIWVVPTYDHVLKTLLPKLEEIDEASGNVWFLTPEQYHYHETQHEFTWVGGGPIWFKSAADAEDAKRIAGPNVAGALVDEPALISQRAWRNTAARVRHPNAKLRQTAAAGTADDLSWMQDYFFDPERPQRYRRYDMSTTENRELLARNPDYLAEIQENATEAEIQAFVHGKGVVLEGQPAYPTFSDTRHWIEGVELTQGLPLLLACDFNVAPMEWVIAQQPAGPHGPELHVVDGISLAVATIDSACDAFLEKYPTWRPGIVVYGDSTGRSRHVRSHRSNYDIIRERLSRAGPVEIKVPVENPPVAARLSAVNRLLLNANGVTRLWIRKWSPFRTCPTRSLVRSLQRAIQKQGSEDLEKPAGETITHASDGLGYLVAYEFPVKKPEAAVGRARIERVM